MFSTFLAQGAHRMTPLLALRNLLLLALLTPLLALLEPTPTRAEEPTTGEQAFAPVMQVLKRYCVGCHNADEAGGGLRLDSYSALLKGSTRGSVITPTRGDLSRLIRVVSGQAKPAMPPADEPQPTAAEIALLTTWIDLGAKGPSGDYDPTRLITPRIELTNPARAPVSAVALAPDDAEVAIARYGAVSLGPLELSAPRRQLAGPRGNVNDLVYSADGNLLVAASGEPGLFGEARLWERQSGRELRVFQGHRDSIYACALNTSGTLLATGGYDRQIKLWDVESGQTRFTLSGHNGAVFDLAFRPDGKVLASASADRTVKLWDVTTGERLDTLKQSTKELYTLAFAPNGNHLAAGGVDNRIRLWQVSPSAQEGTNPLLYSVFAHQAAILRIAYAPHGKTLVSAGEDHTLKLWEMESLTLNRQLEKQPDWVSALAVARDNQTLLVGRLDGSVGKYSLKARGNQDGAGHDVLPEVPDPVDYGAQPPLEKLERTAESEPNNMPGNATSLAVPGVATGELQADLEQTPDVDLFRFQARRGDQWIIETNAARAKSQLDSKIVILDANGKPVPRVLLRAVRDSQVTFRPVGSDDIQARLVNWEEMEINEYLYLNGEVTKLFLKPRGPDSGYQFYPGAGARTGFFDTSGRAQPLGQPCYIVVPYPVGTELPDNGLPTFVLNYENDDASSRKLGSDSRLTFVAPADGEYLIQINDVRNFGGKQFSYELIVRRPQPDFTINLGGTNPTVNAGSGKEFTLELTRIDNFDGPVRIDISGIPAGFAVSTPIWIEAGQRMAKGVIYSLPHAPRTTKENWSQTKVTATAEIFGKPRKHEVGGLGTIKLAGRPKLVTHLRTQGDKGLTPIVVPSPPERTWQPLEPGILKTSSAATLSRQPGQAILASGANPDTGNYTIVCYTESQDIRAIRLDAMGHPSLPHSGPGRADKTGNFVLSEINVTAVSLASPEKSQIGTWSDASADYSQGGWDVRNAIDGNAKTGWSVGSHDADAGYPVQRSGDNPAHWAAFELSEPLGFEGGTMLVITLQQGGVQKQHNLGHFRLSYTATPKPPVAIAFPEIPEVVIAPGSMAQCELRIERNGFEQRVQFDVNNLPHGVIVEDIGLNGVLIPEGQTERTIFLRAENWVPETDRLFHAVAKVEGNLVSFPMRLRVRRVPAAPQDAAAE